MQIFPIRKVFRIFPIIFLVASFCLLLPGITLPSTAQQKDVEIRGVWLTANDMSTLRDSSKLNAAVEQLSQLHLNTLYPVVWNGEYTYYPSDVTEKRNLQSFTYSGLDGQDILADVIKQGHERKLLVIPWFEFGFMTPLSSTLARQHPAWLTQQRDGTMTSVSAAGEVAWLNPFHPEVQKFITELVMEVVENYDLDGIQFDDHMSLPHQFGYDTYTTNLYFQETKKPPPANSQDSAWVQWRADKITTFMESLKKAVGKEKPGIIFSVSPNYYDFAYKLQLQDWLEWVRRNIVDEIIVQVYRSDLESFLPQLSRPEILETQQKIPTAIAIMAGQRSKPVPIELIQSQVMASQQRRLGVVFFYYETLWNRSPETHEIRKSGLMKLFASPASRFP